MRDLKLALEPFENLKIISGKMFKQMGQHATMTISGYIPDYCEDDYRNMSLAGTEASLHAIDENDNEAILFCGTIQNLKISVSGQLRVMVIEVISGSFQMDLVRRTRVFQDTSTHYNLILEHIEKLYKSSSHLITLSDKEIGAVIVQYNETDWEFLRRLASHFFSTVTPVYNKPGTALYFGTPIGTKRTLNSDDAYTIQKKANAYITQDNNCPVFDTEADTMEILIESREIYELGDAITFKEIPYYIYSIDSSFIGQELVHKYLLKTSGGIKTQKFYNHGIIGASLEASIFDVANDTVKVIVYADGLQGSPKWLPYSTVYSSPDGTGWYCMPEVNDTVRIYFPSEREDEAYVISAVHSGCEGSRDTPNNKSLKSKYGKEVLFTENSLLLTNNNGMSIEIVDDEGIRIVSDKDILIKSDTAIQIASATDSVTVIAPQKIEMTQGDTSIKVEKQIVLSGAQVHME